MRINRTKEKLGKAEPVFGTISATPDPLMAEWIALSDFDYHMLDGEHGLFNPGDAVGFVRACELHDITPLVRLGPQDPKLVLQYLDAGFQGVMMPGLMTAEAVDNIGRAMKYPPEGTRGMGPSRAANFQLSSLGAADYIEKANRNTLFIPQFEHPDLLAELESIAKLETVDAIMIGSRDLSLAMGFVSEPNHPDVVAVIDQAIATIRRAEKAAGITAGNRLAVQQQLNRGAKIILCSTHHLLASGIKQWLPG